MKVPHTFGLPRRWASPTATMSGSGELQRKGVLERAFGSILSSLSSSVYVASHDAALSTPVWVALTLIQYLQFLYFPVALMLGGGQTTQILTLVLKVTSLTRIDEEIGPLGFIVVTGIVSAASQAQTGTPVGSRAAFRQHQLQPMSSPSPNSATLPT